MKSKPSTKYLFLIMVGSFTALAQNTNDPNAQNIKQLDKAAADGISKGKESPKKILDEVVRMKAVRKRQEQEIHSAKKSTPRNKKDLLSKNGKVIIKNEENFIKDGTLEPSEKSQVKLQQKIRGAQIKNIKSNKTK